MTYDTGENKIHALIQVLWHKIAFATPRIGKKPWHKFETVNNLAEAYRTFMFAVLEMVPKPTQNVQQISKLKKEKV